MKELGTTRRPTLFWQVYTACLLVSLFSLIGVSFYALHSGAQARTAQVIRDLTAWAHFVVEDMNLGILALSPVEIDAYCKRMGGKMGTRVTLISVEGKVLGDSLADPAEMEFHVDRPEFQQAFRDGLGSAQRYSDILQRDMLYLAMPIERDGAAIAAIRVSLPLLSMRQEFRQKRNNMLVAALLTGLLAALVSAWISKRITRPLRLAQQAVQRFEVGDFSHQMEVPEQQEVAELVLRLNRMAETLEQRLETIRKQGEEESAILAGMVEGVLAVGPDDRLLKVNDAAARLLNIDPNMAEGRLVHEVLRQADLLSYIRHLWKNTDQNRRDVVLQGADEKVLEVNGSMLTAQGGLKSGVIVVLHDVTRLRRLQRVRSEFVANVSHELKSPITSILGFAETLKDGAIEEPDEARRFLGIIERQAKRMYNIIQDLLQLSRIEDSSAQGKISRETMFIRPTVDAAIQQCAERLDEKAIQVECVCDPSIGASVNAPLLEQALVNLIDNAIKYSASHSKVRVAVTTKSHELFIEVSDHGQGIPQEHVPRLFERFYRADKARSREAGGTGLGLAIVKHILQAHGGSVSAVSTLGKGSTFILRIPFASNRIRSKP